MQTGDPGYGGLFSLTEAIPLEEAAHVLLCVSGEWWRVGDQTWIPNDPETEAVAERASSNL